MTDLRSIAAMTVIAACIAAPFLAQRLVVQSLIDPDMVLRSQMLAGLARQADPASQRVPQR